MRPIGCSLISTSSSFPALRQRDPAGFPRASVETAFNAPATSDEGRKTLECLLWFHYDENNGGRQLSSREQSVVPPRSTCRDVRGCLRARLFSVSSKAMKVARALEPAGVAGLLSSGHGDAEGLDSDVFAMAQALIGSRQNVSPKRLVEPGPSARQLDPLLSLAAAVGGQRLPWRPRARCAAIGTHGVDGRGDSEPAAWRPCHRLRCRPHQRAGDGLTAPASPVSIDAGRGPRLLRQHRHGGPAQGLGAPAAPALRVPQRTPG